MAQLIKLQDYISRYGWDVYRYPTQYIRLKQDNWKKLYEEWSNPEEGTEEEHLSSETMKQSRFSRLKRFLKREVESEEEKKEEHILPYSEAELKQYYLDNLMNFQLKWATSTVTDTSFMNRSYYRDPTLKYFLQRFPDTYLIMYYPIFNIRNTPVDGEILLISPIGIEIIKLVEENQGAYIIASDERAWMLETGSQQSKILSPLIALKRTEKLVRSILRMEAIDFPVQKTVLSRANTIVSNSENYSTKIIGKSEYESWFQQKRKLASPLKSSQLKVSEILLKHCRTTSIKRPEWGEDFHPFPVGRGENHA
ncbi:NERD domain-containing protein [Virgibacillus sp. NKC19-16]|uniref:NERD domain-containing protein n=1 Tax=Virgibacillus salidurans TaxID=2831673 RepID=UPI001F1C15E8|nr:NERD domain-containing protein [Virgibacillus sp. NKC19-16]UJL45111.1 NERD domain-containing protein [Virgibacillus sp. NKC19-16]